MDEYTQDIIDETTDASSKQKTDKKKIIIITAVSVGVALVVAAIIFFVFFFNNDKKKLVKALGTLVEDSNSYSDAYVPKDKAKELVEEIANGNSSASYSLNLSGIPGLSATIGIDGDVVRRFEDQKLYTTNDISVMNISIASLNAYADGNTLYLQVPEVFDSIFMLKGDTVGKDFNNSIFSSLLGFTLPENLAIKPFGEGKETDVRFLEFSEVMPKYTNDLLSLYKEMDVTHEKKKEPVTLDNGEELECVIYEVALPKTETNTVLMDIFKDDELGISTRLNEIETKLSDESGSLNMSGLSYEDNYRLEGDAHFLVWVDTDGYVRRIKTADTVDMQGIDFDYYVEFIGAEVETDNIKMDISGTDGVSKLDVTSKVKRDALGYYDVTINSNGDYDFDFNAAGKVKYEEEDESVLLVFDDMQLDVDDEEIFHLSGNITFVNADSTKVDIPKENVMDLMNLNLIDLLSLAAQLKENAGYLQQLYELAGGLF